MDEADITDVGDFVEYATTMYFGRCIVFAERLEMGIWSSCDVTMSITLCAVDVSRRVFLEPLARWYEYNLCCCSGEKEFFIEAYCQRGVHRDNEGFVGFAIGGNRK